MIPELNKIYQGDNLSTMRQWDAGIIQTCVTSPPYWGLRDYGVDGQLGLEKTPQEYVGKMVAVFREVRRVLRDDGTLWLNLGDSFAANRGYQVPDSKHKDVGNSKGMKAADFGLKPKDLVGIPWMVAFALRADGWYLRQDIIWHKPNAMPESVTDRCTKAHEYIFLLAKSEKYFYDHEAIKEDAIHAGEIVSNDNGKNSEMGEYGATRTGFLGDVLVGKKRNKRSVWSVTTKPCKEAHFATFPGDLIVPCILAGCPEGGTVLDPFMGAGTVAQVCLQAGRQFLGCELNPKYIAIAQARIDAEMAQGKLF